MTLVIIIIVPGLHPLGGLENKDKELVRKMVYSGRGGHEGAPERGNVNLEVSRPPEQVVARRTVRYICQCRFVRRQDLIQPEEALSYLGDVSAQGPHMRQCLPDSPQAQEASEIVFQIFKRVVSAIRAHCKALNEDAGDSGVDDSKEGRELESGSVAAMDLPSGPVAWPIDHAEAQP